MQSFSYASFPQIDKSHSQCCRSNPTCPDFPRAISHLQRSTATTPRVKWLQYFSWGANPSPTRMQLPKARSKTPPARAKSQPAKSERVSPEQPGIVFREG